MERPIITKKPLIHHGVDVSKVSRLTLEARWNDSRTRNWLTTTQVWSWDTGDAIVVVTGQLPRVVNYVVLRLGDQVHVIGGQGLSKAMTSLGLDINDYYITTEAELAA